MVRRMCKLLPGHLNSIGNEPIECEEITRACLCPEYIDGPTINSMFNTKFDTFCVSPWTLFVKFVLHCFRYYNDSLYILTQVHKIYFSSSFL